MKNKTTTTLHDRIEFNNSGAWGKEGKSQVWKLGLDVDLRNIAVATQCGGGAISLGRKMSRQQLLGWVKQKVSQGHTVCTVYECCGFGYSLHEQLVEAGARSLITTPMRLNLQ